MKNALKIFSFILLVLAIFSKEPLIKKNIAFLSPESAFEKNTLSPTNMKTMTRKEMGLHILISPQQKVHTAQYTSFTKDTVSTGGGANCTVLLFVNKTQQNWSIWHYPLTIAKGNIQTYMLGEGAEQSFLYSLPIALTALYSNLKRTDECLLYIFGGGSNTSAEQKSINRELTTFFTKIGISEIYDMTPHDKHGRGPVLDQLIISSGKTFDNKSTEPITIKYFYGNEIFDMESASLEVSPRLIGGKTLLYSIIDTSKFTQKAA